MFFMGYLAGSNASRDAHRGNREVALAAVRRRRRAGAGALSVLAVASLVIVGSVPAWAEQPATDPGVAAHGSTGADATTVAPETPALDPAADTGLVSDAPSLRWRAVDASGALVTNVAFEIQGPGLHATQGGLGEAAWADALTVPVVDNAGQTDYVGLDLDSAAGNFEIASLRDLADGSQGHEVASGENYRVRATTAPAGMLTGEWTAVAVTASTNEPVTVIELAAKPADSEHELPAAPETPAVPETPAASDQPAAPEVPTPTAKPSTPKSTGKATASEATAAPRALGPDAPGVAAPYVYWTARDANGALLPGASFELAGPRTSSIFSPWPTARTVTDCTSAPCTGLDRDPDPGEFQVKYTTPATNPTANGVSSSSIYRVRQTAAPAGYSIANTAWRETPGSGTTGNWGGQTYNFGAYTSNVIPPATIIVRTGGDRTGASGVTNLAGVVLMLNTGSGSPSGTRPDGVSGNGTGWARCVSDANGECTFTVPSTESGGTNRDSRYWVVQATTGAPAGWYTNTSLGTDTDSTTLSSTAYTFRTGAQLRSGQTYRSFPAQGSSASFMYDTDNSNRAASGGVWQQSRVNPGLEKTCGIDVALILDLSGSVGSSVGALRSASNAFVDALVGTPSRMSLFSFSSASPAANAAQNYPALTSVATQTQATDFKNRYASWTPSGGTNWDQGIGAAVAADTPTNAYDVAVVITDGSPTFYGPSATGPGNLTRFVELENGVFAANALKEKGTRVLAFGVGDGAGSGSATVKAASALNLSAISGPTLGTDFFQTSTYSDVGNTLRNLALGNCASQLTVTKMVVPNTAPAGSIAGAAPAVGGWEFTASNPGAGMTLPNPPVRVTENDGTGTVAFPLTFAGGTASAPVTVTETQQPGYTLVPVNGQNAVCTNLVTGAAVTPVGNPTNGFRVAVPNAQTVNCVVYNRAPDQSATVQVDKVWRVIDGSGGPAVTYRIPGDEGRLPAGLAGQLTLTGPGTAGATNQAWGTPRANYKAAGSVAINETVDIDKTVLPGCSLTSNQVTKIGSAAASQALPYTGTLTPGANTFEVTNTVTCASQLTLLKTVEDGSASPANWNLTANGGTGQTYTVSGNVTRSAGNTFGVVTARDYALTETPADPNAPLAYLLDRVERCDPNPAAAGGCDWQVIDEAAPVSVGVGQHAVYRFVNKSAPALEVPLTGGLSSDAVGIAGAGLAGLALLIGSVAWMRRRRHEQGAA